MITAVESCRRDRRTRPNASRFPKGGVTYLNNRHYDPTTGVFVSVDPLVTKTGEPYAYGSANPVTYSDPSGLCAMVSGDLWCGSGNITRAEQCTTAGAGCSNAATRQSFKTLRHTSRGKAIALAIETASQGDLSRADGNWSRQDVEAAANGDGLVAMLGGDDAAASVVQSVASSLLGQDEFWEGTDRNLTFWDNNAWWIAEVAGGASLALSILAFTPCAAGSVVTGWVSTAATCSSGGSVSCGASVVASTANTVTFGLYGAGSGLNAGGQAISGSGFWARNTSQGLSTVGLGAQSLSQELAAWQVLFGGGKFLASNPA